jgi:hypothetical protein
MAIHIPSPVGADPRADCGVEIRLSAAGMIGNALGVWLLESLASDSTGFETCILLVRECCNISSEDSAEIPWFFESCEGEALRSDRHHLTRGRCRDRLDRSDMARVISLPSVSCVAAAAG